MAFSQRRIEREETSRSMRQDKTRHYPYFLRSTRIQSNLGNPKHDD
jgi:hypothetical protein